MPVRLKSGTTVDALCFVVDRDHPQYAGALSAEHAASVVRGAVGRSGGNEDYVRTTVEHLRALRIRDPWLEWVAALVDDGLRGAEPPVRPAL